MSMFCFVRLALRHGAQAQSSPAQSFENTDFVALPDVGSSRTRNQTPVLCIDHLQETCGHFSLHLLGPWSLFSQVLGLVRLARPITTVVGRPIPVPQCRQPTEVQVDHYHVFYMKALEQLFEERKESCGRPAYTRRTSIQPWPHPSPPPGPPSP
ncbi:2-acylglycerol O-acyltransferase 3-like [Cervus elaphus]|uniref:2-acylglycerol O-acyltransferase 3-like n=1 Tax=Cervus elaphus TaxID=9860 RepID=UPI001CC2D7FD|nr:2-acylglycerol O-acyltransferase 3-like [Cervus elaphus]